MTQAEETELVLDVLSQEQYRLMLGALYTEYARGGFSENELACFVQALLAEDLRGQRWTYAAGAGQWLRLEGLAYREGRPRGPLFVVLPARVAALMESITKEPTAETPAAEPAAAGAPTRAAQAPPAVAPAEAAQTGPGVAGAEAAEPAPPVAAVENAPVCPHCGGAMDEGAHFCGNCGQAVDLPVTCPACGARVPRRRFCGRCGAALS